GVLESLGLADIQAADGEVSAQIGGHAPEAVNPALGLADVPAARLDTPRPRPGGLVVGLTRGGFRGDRFGRTPPPRRAPAASRPAARRRPRATRPGAAWSGRGCGCCARSWP